MQKFERKLRLCKKTHIEELFKKGNIINEAPFSIIFLFKKQEDPINVLISIPKKQISKAVVRNKLKRIIREVYRKNNTEIINSLIKAKKQLHIAFIYKSKEIKSFMFLEEKIRLILLRLIKQI